MVENLICTRLLLFIANIVHIKDHDLHACVLELIGISIGSIKLAKLFLLFIFSVRFILTAQFWSDKLMGLS